MAFDINSIQKSMDISKIQNNFDVVATKVANTVEKTAATLSTTLNKEVGQVVNGFQSLTQNADVPVAIMTNAVGEISSLTNKVVAEASNLQALAGKIVADGFLDDVVALPTAAALAEVVKDVTGKTAQELPNLLGKISGAPIADIAGIVDGISADLSDVVSSIEGSVAGTLANLNQGFGSTIQNAVEKVTQGANSAITGLISANLKFTAADMKNVIGLIDVDKLEEAVSAISKVSVVGLEDIDTTIKGIKTTISQNVTAAARETNTTIPDAIASGLSSWDGVNTPTTHKFTYIKGEDELEIELKSIKREITEVIVHWTETTTDKNIGAEEIQKLYAASKNPLNRDGIDYHYIIRRDGRIQRGRPVDVVSNRMEGHSEYVIHVAFVGGLNCPSGTPNPTRFLSAQSFNQAQWDSFDSFLKMFYRAYPGGQVIGHNNIEPDPDPGFDVIEYVKTHFNKKTIYTNPSQQSAFSPAEIIGMAPAYQRPKPEPVPAPIINPNKNAAGDYITITALNADVADGIYPRGSRVYLAATDKTPRGQFVVTQYWGQDGFRETYKAIPVALIQSDGTPNPNTRGPRTGVIGFTV